MEHCLCGVSDVLMFKLGSIRVLRCPSTSEKDTLVGGLATLNFPIGLNEGVN